MMILVFCNIQLCRPHIIYTLLFSQLKQIYVQSSSPMTCLMSLELFTSANKSTDDPEVL